MIKDYKSYYEDWLSHENAWSGFSAKEISTNFAEALKLADEANNTILSSRLDGISYPSISIQKYDISRLETTREKLELFCKKIHTDAENIIDDVFHYGVMKTLTDIYALNPSEITCTLGGNKYDLKSEMEKVIIDPALKADFSKNVGKLDKDELADNFKEGLIEAVNRYYDGNVTPYMTKAAGKDIDDFKEDMDLVIEYYEYLNPKEGKDLNKFLSGLAKDSDKKFQEDIRNIKFIAYTAREPYQSVFFKYLSKLKIFDYDYPEVDKAGNGLSQYYNSNKKTLYLRFYGNSGEGKNDPRGAYVTFFHEVGHGIDDLMMKDDRFLSWTTKANFLSVMSEGTSVFKAAENDVRMNIRETVIEYLNTKKYKLKDIQINDIVEGIMTYGFEGFEKGSKAQEIYESVIKEYQDKFSIRYTNATVYNGISDVYGGYTDNKLKGVYGHSNEIDKGNTYWNDLKSDNKYRGSQGKELWAHIFARFMTSNDEVILELKKYFPTSIKIMESELEEHNKTK